MFLFLIKHMNTQQNMKKKCDDATRGNSVAHFERMKKTISINDGIRYFTPKTVSSHDQNTPFLADEVTYLSITNKDHHISQISEGYIHIIAKYNLRISGITSTDISDENKLLKLFVGHKSSNQIMYQLWIRSNNAETGYEQNQMIREGFAMAAIQDHCSKSLHKYTHSLYEDVAAYNQYVCGTYVNLDDIKDGAPHPYEVEYIIPFDDICALQAFDEYPNGVVGDIELKFYVRDTGLVWCMVDPRTVLDVKTLLQDEDVDVELPTKGIIFDHKFAQIGNPANIVRKFTVTDKKATLESGVCTLSCDSMVVTKCEANMKGFKVCDKSLKEIARIFSTPVYIPSQELNYNAFPTPAGEDGLQDTLNTALFNVTSMYVMFPRRPGDITCFENPCIDNFYIKALGVQYPDKVGSTLGARFLQDQLVAADLDGGLKPTRELVDSYTMVKNDGNGVRYKNSLSDATSFCAIIQTECGGAGYVFDGIDSSGQSVPIEIGFRPLHRGVNDTYFNVVTGDRPATHPPAPQLWLIRDTYWSVDTAGGLQYHKFGTPEELQMEL